MSMLDLQPLLDKIAARLTALGLEVTDVRTHEPNTTRYPRYGGSVRQVMYRTLIHVRENDQDLGFLTVDQAVSFYDLKAQGRGRNRKPSREESKPRYGYSSRALMTRLGVNEEAA